jgi:transposase
MTDHTTMPKISRLEVVATGARRRWTPEAKQRIVAESYLVPRNVSATARRHGMSTSQLFTWRRQAREGKLCIAEHDVAFVPAVIAEREAVLAGPQAGGGMTRSTTRACTQTPVAGRMEIVLAGSRRLIVGSDVESKALARVLEILERQ